jgi:hypothetical protein
VLKNYLPSLPPTADTRTPLHLGGTEKETNVLGGTCVRAIALGGAVVDGNALGGTVVDGNALAGTVAHVIVYGGTAVRTTYDSGLDEWTMQEVDIGLAEFNDETLALTITSSGSALNLTGITLEMYLKTASGIADTDPSTLKLSTVTGEIVITNPTGGLATAAIASSHLQPGGTVYGWYRVDTINAGKRNTAIYGKVAITPL